MPNNRALVVLSLFIFTAMVGGLAMDLLGLIYVFCLVGTLGLVGIITFYQLMS